MPLATSHQMLLDARRDGYAVAAFNTENMEMLQAITAAAQEERSPVLIQTTPGTLKYAPPALYGGMAAAGEYAVPVAMHLDHGSSLELARQALEAGYTSIMIDGSKLPLEENIALTRSVVEICRPRGVPVEGELGKVGGKEDDTENNGPGAGYTDPEEAVRFVAETGVSSLAVGVGTAHGVYKEQPKLNLELISRLRETLDLPLVLHGASGLSDGDIRECVRRGIAKVNFATELRIAFTAAVRDYLAAHPDCIDPKAYGGAGREAVRKLAAGRIRVCGCNGAAG